MCKCAWHLAAYRRISLYEVDAEFNGMCTRWLMMSDEHTEAHSNYIIVVILLYWKLYQIAIKNEKKRNKKLLNPVWRGAHEKRDRELRAKDRQRPCKCTGTVWFHPERLELRENHELAQCELWTCSGREMRMRTDARSARAHRSTWNMMWNVIITSEACNPICFWLVQCNIICLIVSEPAESVRIGWNISRVGGCHEHNSRDNEFSACSSMWCGVVVGGIRLILSTEVRWCHFIGRVLEISERMQKNRNFNKKSRIPI